MKHQHAANADVNVKLEIPAKEIESLIDKATDAAITIISVYTAAHILRSVFDPK